MAKKSPKTSIAGALAALGGIVMVPEVAAMLPTPVRVIGICVFVLATLALGLAASDDEDEVKPLASPTHNPDVQAVLDEIAAEKASRAGAPDT